jgi:hypothetical protein
MHADKPFAFLPAGVRESQHMPELLIPPYGDSDTGKKINVESCLADFKA